MFSRDATLVSKLFKISRTLILGTKTNKKYVETLRKYNIFGILQNPLDFHRSCTCIGWIHFAQHDKINIFAFAVQALCRIILSQEKSFTSVR